MDIINYNKIQDALSKVCHIDGECIPECSALILDIGSGELVAVWGIQSHTDAANKAGSFHVIWKSQDDTAGQHDDKIESVMICNQRKNNFLVAIPHAKSRSTEDGFLLAVTVPHSIEFGALKRSTEQTAQNLRAMLYAPIKK